jgi:hypothetical protein
VTRSYANKVPRLIRKILMKHTYVVAIFLCGILSCSSGNNPGERIASFDISPDGKQAVLSFRKSNLTWSIVTLDFETGAVKELFSATNEDILMRPRYSASGDQIIYIEKAGRIPNKSRLITASIDGKNKRTLIEESLITEALFRNKDRAVVFCKAREYLASSPIGVPAPHGLDLFELQLDNLSVRQLTHINAYGINSVSAIDSGRLLFRLEGADDGGIYMLAKNSQLSRIVPLNDPRNNATYYNTPNYDSLTQTMVFTAPYEIYSMILPAKIATKLYRSDAGHIYSLKLSSDGRKAIFILDIYRKSLFSIEVNTGKLTETKIRIQDK